MPLDPRDMGGGYAVIIGVLYSVAAIAAGFLFHAGWNLWDRFTSINW